MPSTQITASATRMLTRIIHQSDHTVSILAADARDRARDALRLVSVQRQLNQHRVGDLPELRGGNHCRDILRGIPTWTKDKSSLRHRHPGPAQHAVTACAPRP